MATETRRKTGKGSIEKGANNEEVGKEESREESRDGIERSRTNGEVRDEEDSETTAKKAANIDATNKPPLTKANPNCHSAARPPAAAAACVITESLTPCRAPPMKAAVTEPPPAMHSGSATRGASRARCGKMPVLIEGGGLAVLSPLGPTSRVRAGPL